MSLHMGFSTHAGLSVIDTCWMRGAWALVSVLMHIITTAVILVLVAYCLVKVWEADQVTAGEHAVSRWASDASR